MEAGYLGYAVDIPNMHLRADRAPGSPRLRETVLERFLKTVWYSRRTWDGPDLHLLFRCVGIKLSFCISFF